MSALQELGMLAQMTQAVCENAYDQEEEAAEGSQVPDMGPEQVC